MKTQNTNGMYSDAFLDWAGDFFIEHQLRKRGIYFTYFLINFRSVCRDLNITY